MSDPAALDARAAALRALALQVEQVADAPLRRALEPVWQCPHADAVRDALREQRRAADLSADRLREHARQLSAQADRLREERAAEARRQEQREERAAAARARARP